MNKVNKVKKLSILTINAATLHALIVHFFTSLIYTFSYSSYGELIGLKLYTNTRSELYEYKKLCEYKNNIFYNIFCMMMNQRWRTESFWNSHCISMSKRENNILNSPNKNFHHSQFHKNWFILCVHNWSLLAQHILPRLIFMWNFTQHFPIPRFYFCSLQPNWCCTWNALTRRSPMSAEITKFRSVSFAFNNMILLSKTMTLQRSSEFFPL